MTDGTIARLARTFQIRVKSIRTVKSGVYRLETEGGRAYALKHMRYPVRRILWMDRTLRRVRKNGFAGICWRDPRQTGGKPLFVRLRGKKATYILTPWVQGRQPSPDSSDDLRACAAALARFHLAGRRAAIPRQGALDLTGRWPAILKARLSLIRKYVSKAKTAGNGNELDVWLRKNGDDLLGRGEQALGLLERSPYRRLCRVSSRSRVLCHGDSGPKNFVFTGDGPKLIDFETLRLDLRAYDLYRLIRLACKHRGWSFAAAKAVLEGYGGVSKLEPGELRLVQAWLLFPNKAYKILSRSGKTSAKGRRALTQELRSAAAADLRLPSFLREWDDYAREEGKT